MSDVAQWLDDLGLGQYAAVFSENDVGLRALPFLSEEDLKELGVSLGHRRVLLAAISELDGQRISTVTEAPKQKEAIASDAERRQLTVMFCDMVGSTALSTRIDPEDYREAIRAYQDACAGVIARFDGYVARFMGDGVLAYFGWPRAHEDDAARAINAGLGVIEAVGALSPPDGASEPVAVRIGIATGPVVIGDIIGEGGSQEAAATGETLNLAARLETIAATNTLVISDETHALASGLFDYESLGPQKLKGIDGTPEVWRVVAVRQVESRFAAAHGEKLTPLIGREEELELLKRRWRRATDGEGQVVLLAGEPGIGKSRLTRALQDAISDDPHTRVLLQCSPHYTSSALYPVISQFELAARFQSGDDPAARLDKLSSLLSQGEQPTDEAMALIAALLSIPADEHYPLPKLTPQQQKDRTLTALNVHLAGLAAEKPVLFVLEDAHWIDPTTLELMELAIERIRDLPVLIVVTYRPEFTAPWIGEDHVTLLALNRLSRKERTLMAEALIGELALSPEALAQIAERSDGIPLFIEELTKSVREAGIGSAGSGDYGAAAGIDIPATLQDALEARFDRSPAVREVAQVGAAIGREFRYDLLAHVSDLSPPELISALDDLVESGLVFTRGTPPDATYTFKHALIQDTAYDSMVRSKRQGTHKIIAEVLRDLRTEVAETEPETLAHHYTEAGLMEAAIEWWSRAGRAASARSANPEALALVQRGLALIEELPETEARDRQELALQIDIVPPLITVKGQTAPELEAAFNRALELCESLDAKDEWFRASAMKFLFLVMSSRMGEAFELAQDFSRQAELSANEGAKLIGRWLLGRSLLFLGRMQEALTEFEQIRSIFDRKRHGQLMLDYGQDPGVTTEAYRAVLLWTLGWPDKADKASGLSIQSALDLGQLNSLGPVLCWGGILPQMLRRDIDALKRIVPLFQSMVSHYSMPVFGVWAKNFHTLIEISIRPSLQSATRFQSYIDELVSATRGPTMVLPLLHCWLAEVYLTIGEAAKVLEVISAASKIAEDGEEHWCDAEILRIRGEALSATNGLGKEGDAESSMLQAIEIAKSQCAKSFELRAATSLARLLRDQGRTDEARETLAPAYNWFTEGFDTPDLKDAKALLVDLD